jgi:predicted transcriptional regulator
MPGQLHQRLPDDVEQALAHGASRRQIPKTEAVRRAIVMWKWLEDHRADGWRVVALKDGEAERELMWP